MSLSKVAPARLALVAVSFALLAPLRAQDGAQPAAQSSNASSAPQVSDAHSAIARLVPADAVCIIQVPSIDALAKAVNALMHAAEPEAKEELEIDMILGMLEIPGDAALIDHKKPMAMCFSLDAERFEPVPTFILPVTSPDEFLKSLPQPDETPSPDGTPPPAKPVTLGNYVGVTELPKYAVAEKPRSLAESLMPGVVSARLDLERIFEITRPMIEPMLEQGEEAMASASSSAVPGLDTQALAKGYMDGFRTFMDSAETLDLAASMQGDRADISVAFTALEKSALAEFGSKEKSGVESLSKFLDPEASFSAVLGMDMASIAKKFEPILTSMLAAYPEPMRASFNASMASISQIYPLLGSGLATSFDFSPTGLRGTCYFHPKDPKAVIDLYTKIFKEMKMPGVVIQGPDAITVDGLALTTFNVTADPKAIAATMGEKADPAATGQLEAMMKQIYGENGMRVAFGAKGDELVQVFGGDEAYMHRALAVFKDGGHKLPPDLAPLLARISGTNPCFMARIDMARLVGEVMLLAFAPGPAAGTPAANPASAPLTLYGGVAGRVWSGGASWDMARVAAAMKEARGFASQGESAASPARSKVKADIARIDEALMKYQIQNNGRYPDTLGVLIVADANGDAYLEGGAVPLDPWGREYLYVPPGTGHPKAHIYTNGKDGKPGGMGEDADIDERVLYD
jgi:general secretion pathway protein G